MYYLIRLIPEVVGLVTCSTSLEVVKSRIRLQEFMIRILRREAFTARQPVKNTARDSFKNFDAVLCPAHTTYNQSCWSVCLLVCSRESATRQCHAYFPQTLPCCRTDGGWMTPSCSVADRTYLHTLKIFFRRPFRLATWTFGCLSQASPTPSSP